MLMYIYYLFVAIIDEDVVVYILYYSCFCWINLICFVFTDLVPIAIKKYKHDHHEYITHWLDKLNMM